MEENESKICNEKKNQELEELWKEQKRNNEEN